MNNSIGLAARVYFVMGVSGSGKSTIGHMLSARLGIPFHDGDDYHLEANVEKMRSGIPLEDEDRWPWLQSLNQLAKDLLQKNGGVIATSALKRSYRRVLDADIESQIQWIYLDGDQETIKNRLEQRTEHFMPDSLLDSQFDTLEEPRHALSIDILLSPKDLIQAIMDKLNTPASAFGLLGLGVMGKSLSLNLARNGFSLSLYNRRVEGVEEEVALNFIEAHEMLQGARGFEDLEAFVQSLETPRRMLLMIPAGKPVDAMLEQLGPLLSEGDVILDGGNSHYEATRKRQERAASFGVQWLGVGVSGGEEGALKGPSVMPGGPRKAFELVKDYLFAISAKDKNGTPCCAYIGPEGAGHFIKMVHNGIEYAEMQVLAELYDVFRRGFHWSPGKIADLLDSWKEKGLGSYLLEITVDILRYKEGEHYLLDLILDKAGNKGTGSWTTIAAAELGVPIPNLTAALFARYQSSFKELRVKAEAAYDIESAFPSVYQPMIEAFEKAYALARLVNHQQGFHLLKEASDTYEWELDLNEIARVWTNGCIIRSELMDQLVTLEFPGGQLLMNLELQNEVRGQIIYMDQFLRTGSEAGIPLPCFSSSWHYLLSYFSAESSANLIQAQRDYFGAHTYRRTDDTSGKSYHTDWNKPASLD